jgi:hypothetical protein
MPNFEIRATADVSQATAGLGKLQTELGKTAATAAKSDAAISKAANGIGKTLPSGANQATNALTNLGRVAQDSAFGFVGIANNLNPLVESFQRLRAETGSGKAAFSALASSIAGPGGIGLAISALTAIISFSQIGFSAWTRGFSNSAKGLSEVAKEIKSSGEVIQEATTSVQGQVATVQALANVVLNTNEAYSKRKQALDELQKINKSYFGDLDLEASKLKVLQGRVIEYTNALVQQAAIKGFEQELSKISLEIFKQEKNVKSANEAVRFYRKGLTDLSSFNPKGIASVDSKSVFAQTNLAAAKKNLEDQNNALAKLNSQYADLKSGITNAVNESLKFKPLGSDDGEKSKKKIRTITDVLKELDNQIQFLNNREILFLSSENKGKLDALGDALNELLKDFKLKPTNPIILDLKYQIDSITAEVEAQEFKRQLGSLFLPGEVVSVPKKYSFKLVLEPLKTRIDSQRFTLGLMQAFLNEQALKDFQGKATTAINQTFTNIINDSISTFADTIGKTLAGQGSFLPNLFEGLIKGIGDQVKELGKTLVRYGVQMIIARKAIEKLAIRPEVAVIAGFALQILGSTLAAAANKKFGSAKFATGVRNFEGGIATVGERGPETVLLPRGSSVVPNNEVMAYGGGGITLMPSIAYDGTQFRIFLNRVDAKLSRTG